MADRYLKESSAVDGYQLEDGSGVLLTEESGFPAGWMMTRSAPAVLRAAAAGAVVFALGMPLAPAADAATGLTDGGNILQTPWVHNAPIAGPMARGRDLTWLPRLPDLVRPIPLTTSVHVRPIAVDTDEVAWWSPRLQDAVRSAPVSQSVYAAPLTVQAPATINWIFQRPPDAARLLTANPSTLVQPLAGSSNLPWQFTGAPLVLLPPPVRPFVALNPTTPAPQAVTYPWGIPPGSLVFRPVARYEAVYAKPIQPLNPDFRSDLPWLLTGAPIVLAQVPIRSVLALNPTTPAVGGVTLPWLVQVPQGQPQPSLIRSQRVTPLGPSSTLPWTQIPPLVRALMANPSQLASPLRVQVDVGWWRQGPDAAPRVVLITSRLVSPIQPLNPDGRSDLPWLPQAPPGKPVPVGAPSSMALPPLASILASVGLSSWIVIVPGWPDIIIVEAWPDTIIPEPPTDMEVP
jgi:hypothetical protein